jgi:putative hydrolase of the HAD superfamily
MKTPVIKAVMLDYGGTIDTNGDHWAEIFRQQYQAAHIFVAKEIFREAYKHAERSLALHPIILPEFTFLDTLKEKIRLQLEYLLAQGQLSDPHFPSIQALSEKMAQACYQLVVDTVEQARPTLASLSQTYPLVLVSNFYGNLTAVLDDLLIRNYFNHLIESAVVGVRKPDPAIFAMGVRRIGCDAENVVVVGDSYTKDIVPAKAAGCRTIWLKGQEWEASPVQDAADYIIHSLEEINIIL